jgi:hypothetical protein
MLQLLELGVEGDFALLAISSIVFSSTTNSAKPGRGSSTSPAAV